MRVSSTSVRVPATISAARRLAVATPESRCRKFSAVRSPVRIERAEPSMRATVRTVASPQEPSSASRVTRTLRIDGREDGLDHRQAAHHASLLLEDLGGRLGLRRDGRLGGDIAAPDVLGERKLDDRADGIAARKAGDSPTAGRRRRAGAIGRSGTAGAVAVDDETGVMRQPPTIRTRDESGSARALAGCPASGARGARCRRADLRTGTAHRAGPAPRQRRARPSGPARQC